MGKESGNVCKGMEQMTNHIDAAPVQQVQVVVIQQVRSIQYAFWCLRDVPECLLHGAGPCILSVKRCQAILMSLWRSGRLQRTQEVPENSQYPEITKQKARQTLWKANFLTSRLVLRPLEGHLVLERQNA